METIGDIWTIAPGDDVLFDQWTRNLNRKTHNEHGELLPYGLQAHSVKSIRKACEVFQPTSILEIGFNMGCSAAMWLNLTSAKLVSVDISDKKETLAAAKALTDEFPGRFGFLHADSKSLYPKVKDQVFDMIFIDGGHLEEDVYADIMLGMQLGIKKFVFDDWLPEYGPGTQPAIARTSLKVTHLLGGNIILATLD